jgi:hypothetical protein
MSRFIDDRVAVAIRSGVASTTFQKNGLVGVDPRRPELHSERRQPETPSGTETSRSRRDEPGRLHLPLRNRPSGTGSTRGDRRQVAYPTRRRSRKAPASTNGCLRPAKGR